MTGDYAGGAPIPGNNAAIWSVVLGILGLSPCTFILSPIAWMMGNKALAEVERTGIIAARGKAQAGRVMGIIGTVLGVLLIGAIAAMWLWALTLDP